MNLRALRLLRIELTVAELDRAERFYVDALGFAPLRRGDADAATAALLGADRIREVELGRGGQTLVLQGFQPAGAPYPPGVTACDLLFQHFAMPVPDMRDAYARLRPFAPAPISNGGPQHLPKRSGGATAYKFRDPDGHPLELIQFPDGHCDGIDHSAIAVADAERSIAFYRDGLGLRVASRQVNTGAEQDALDGLAGVVAEVVALEPPERPTPHVELLAYRPAGRRVGMPMRPCDVAATRLVLQVAGAHGSGDRACPTLAHDPDGHALVLTPSMEG